MYVERKIRPLSPVTIFEAADIQNAFRFLQKGDHIGKAIIRMPLDVSTIPREPAVYSLQFDRQATYLITGGFGGLGMVVMKWMTQRGARNFVVMSPSAGKKPEHQNFIDDMARQGCLITPVPGEVQRAEDVDKAIAEATKPIRGVIHLAMVLKVNRICSKYYSSTDALNYRTCQFSRCSPLNGTKSLLQSAREQ